MDETNGDTLYFVFGVGKTGTSTVFELLHDKCTVRTHICRYICMNEKIVKSLGYSVDKITYETFMEQVLPKFKHVKIISSIRNPASRRMSQFFNDTAMPSMELFLHNIKHSKVSFEIISILHETGKSVTCDAALNIYRKYYHQPIPWEYIGFFKNLDQFMGITVDLTELRDKYYFKTHGIWKNTNISIDFMIYKLEYYNDIKNILYDFLDLDMNKPTIIKLSTREQLHCYEDSYDTVKEYIIKRINNDRLMNHPLTKELGY